MTARPEEKFPVLRAALGLSNSAGTPHVLHQRQRSAIFQPVVHLGVQSHGEPRLVELGSVLANGVYVPRMDGHRRHLGTERIERCDDGVQARDPSITVSRYPPAHRLTLGFPKTAAASGDNP